MVSLVALVCSVMVLTPLARQGPSHEEAIRELVRRYVDARQASDPAAIRELFTADADQLTSSGEWRRGADALVRGMLASSKENAGTRRITLRTIRQIGADTAVADGEYSIAPADGGAVRQMWTSFVVVRTSPGRWQIAAIRNMLPAVPASQVR